MLPARQLVVKTFQLLISSLLYLPEQQGILYYALIAPQEDINFVKILSVFLPRLSNVSERIWLPDKLSDTLCEAASVTNDSESDHEPISEELLDYFRDVASNVSGFVGRILDDDHNRDKYGGTDGRSEFINIIHILISLCGSEKSAINWLFDARRYEEIAGGAPYLPIENGDFWSLAAMLDWLKIIHHFKDRCPSLINSIFRDAHYGDTDPPVDLLDLERNHQSLNVSEVCLNSTERKYMNEDVPGG